MSYQRPQDAYIHSNGSEYDTRYQPGAYQDEPHHNAADYYGYTSSPRVGAESPAFYKAESQYEMEPQAAGHGQYASAPYQDYSSSRQNLAAPGRGAAPGE